MSALELLLRRRVMMGGKKRINYFRFTALRDGANAKIVKRDNQENHPMQYSINGGEFVDYVFGEDIIINTNEYVEWRRKPGFESGGLCNGKFNGGYSIDVGRGYSLSGDIFTLLNENVDEIESISPYCFNTFFGSNNQTYVSVVIPNVLIIPEDTLYSNTYGLLTVEVPATVERIDSRGLYLYGGSVVKMKSNTPPTIASNFVSNTSSTKIYVPYSADHSILNAYKTESVWSNYASKIFELDENGEIPE